MPRRLRIQDPDLIFHVTNRTQEAKYLLVPDDELNAIVMRRLRVAVRIHGIELFAAVIMGNHFHLVLRAPRMNLHKFMCYFQSYLARDVNKLRRRYDAAVFPRRYGAEPILDEESLESMLAYVMMNPVAANLVDFPGHYPGYISWHQHVGAAQPERHTEEPPPIQPPPMWAHLSPEELEEKWRKLLEAPVARCARERTRPTMGARRVREVKWYKRPKRPKRSFRRPLCHARDKATWIQFVTVANAVHTRYRKAMIAWRKGEVALFPFGTVPPGWPDCECRRRRPIPPEFRLAQRRDDVAAA